MIILDTHVLVWWVNNPKKLSTKAREAIEKEMKTGGILVSSISVWEIYMLVKKGRLKLKIDIDTWLGKVEELPFLEFVPVDNTIAAKSVTLPKWTHKDPADRMIVATALQNGSTLLTSDERIRNYLQEQSIW